MGLDRRFPRNCLGTRLERPGATARNVPRSSDPGGRLASLPRLPNVPGLCFTVGRRTHKRKGSTKITRLSFGVGTLVSTHLPRPASTSVGGRSDSDRRVVRVGRGSGRIVGGGDGTDP